MIRVAACLLFGLLVGLLPPCRRPLADSNPTAISALAAAQRILDHARAESARDCTHPSDGLGRILCDKTLRVGLRAYYPGFSVRGPDGAFAGFEVDIARRIAAFLGVRFVPVAVDPKTRIPMVASRDVDLVIATMGHDLRRDSQISFIRPHYYLSRTVVVGDRSRRVADWDDLATQTVCLPVGSSSNMLFIRHQVRILTFDRPEQLLDALRFNKCAFIVHDDTFFGALLTEPGWSSRFDVKFGFAPLPWGMAVARDGTAQLAALLTALSVAFHADGTFLDLARAHRLDLAFLDKEHARWSSAACVTEAGAPAADCLLPPADNTDANDRSGLAPHLAWLESSLAQWFGIRIDMSLLSRRSAVDLLLRGIAYSLATVGGALVATTLFALILARLMGAGPMPVRRGVSALAMIGQTSPLPLLLFMGYVVAGGIVPYSGLVALTVAVLVIGFYNGCNAARAINEAYRAGQARRVPPAGASGSREQGSFMDAVSDSAIQLTAFLINAAKGSPGAGMIGVPEFLNVLTDLTAYSRDRVTVYLILLVFYTGLVLAVITLLSAMETRLRRRRVEHG